MYMYLEWQKDTYLVSIDQIFGVDSTLPFYQVVHLYLAPCATAFVAPLNFLYVTWVSHNSNKKL